MKRILLTVIIGLWVGCSAPPVDRHAVEGQNDSLKIEIKNEKNKSSPSYPRVEIEGTEVRTLVSRYTLQSYDLYIKFPMGYEAGKNYPVLYVLDAEVNFGGVSYIIQRLIRDELIPRILLVGIADHGETDEDAYYTIRQLDFTSTIDKQFTRKAGGAAHFLDFLESELFPFIEGNYKTAPSDRALYGHSLGGLFGFYSMLNRPALFNKYILLSPSLWWGNKSMLNEIKTVALRPRPLTLYVATGEMEGEMVDDQLKMAELLVTKNPEYLFIKSEILKNETHRSIFGAGFTNGLRFVYGKQKSH